jgi:hypothetical protein
MNFGEFPTKYPGIILYINQLKEKYHKNGIDGFYGHNLLVVGGNEEERKWSTLYTPFVLRNFLLEHIEKHAAVYKKRIICTNKSVKQIKSEIFETPTRQALKNSIKKPVEVGLYPQHVIELLTLFDIHKGMKPLLNKLAEEFASDYSLPPRYRLGLVIATLKPGEKISELPEPFVCLCERLDLSKLSKPTNTEKKKTHNVDDVKLEISVNSMGMPVLDAIVSSKDVTNEKLSLEDRFLTPLYLLAKAVRDDDMEGWVPNKDLEKKCLGDGVSKAKYEIIQSFKKIIKERASGIISTKGRFGRRLNIPKKNIKFKRIK